MMEAGDLRPGNTVEKSGELLQVLDFAHVKMGRGSAIVRAKFKNVNTGAVTEETFRPEEKFLRARIERTDAQFLSKDFWGRPIVRWAIIVPWAASLVITARLFTLIYDYYHGILNEVLLRLHVISKPIDFLGDDVPLFVTQGERIRVDTRNGRYMERVT